MFKRSAVMLGFVVLLGVFSACGFPQVSAPVISEADAVASVTAAVMTVVAEVSPTVSTGVSETVLEPTVTSTPLLATSTVEPLSITDTPVPPTPLPTPTAVPSPTTAPVASAPPRVTNNAPGGTAAEYAEGEVIVNDYFLFRMHVLDTRSGSEDGAGIDYVEFFVSAENGDPIYSRRENNAGYCIFGGGEPNCNSWPQRNGRYVWGGDGPEIQPGKHFVSIIVTPKNQDFQGETWNWNFEFTVSLP